MAVNSALLQAIQGGLARESAKKQRRAESLAALASLGGAAVGGLAGGLAGEQFDPANLATGLAVGQAAGQTLGGLAAGPYGHAAALQGAQNVPAGFNPMIQQKLNEQKAQSLADVAQGKFVGISGQQADPDQFRSDAARQGYFEGQFERQMAEAKGGGGANDPASVAETRWFLSQPPEVQEQHLRLKRAQQLVNQGAFTRNLATGEIYNYIPRETETAEHAAEVERQRGEAKKTVELPKLRLEAQKRIDVMEDKAGVIERNVNNALKMIDEGAGVGQGAVFQADWLATNAGKLRKVIDSIAANFGIAELQAAKAGGATFGALGEKELELLLSTQGPIDQRYPDLLRDTLTNVLSEYQKKLDREKRYYQIEFGGSAPGEQGGGKIPKPGEY